MPIVVEPKNEESTQQVVTPSEPELFASEIAMEKSSSNFLPLVLIVSLVVIVGGGIYYFVKGVEDVLTVPAATKSVTQILSSLPPASVHFTVGTVQSNGGEKALDPRYELLSKAGIVTIKPKAKGSDEIVVTLTNIGESLLSGMNGVEKTPGADGNTKYTVPLAVRKLVSIDKVTTIKPHLAQAEYSWKWEPNSLGEDFDASGSLVKSFSSYDRTTLIKSYGVDFYSGPPTKASIVLLEGDNDNWTRYSE